MASSAAISPAMRRLRDCSKSPSTIRSAREPLATLTLATREDLGYLVVIVNCNRRRCDGPGRRCGHMVRDLDTLLTGAGWNVSRLLWGSDWDALFARDARETGGELVDALT